MALIKHANVDDLATVAPLDLSARAMIASGPLEPFLEQKATPVRVPTESEKQLADLRQKINALEERLIRDVAKAREDGRKEAEQTFVKDEASRLSMLKANLEAAVTTATASFNSMEKLALVVCEDALAKVFAKPASYRQLVADAIAKQLGSLRKETVLGIHVSAQDFSDSKSLEALALAAGTGNITLHRDDELRTGACRISVRLGHIELSLPEHWEAMKSAFSELMAEASNASR